MTDDDPSIPIASPRRIDAGAAAPVRERAVLSTAPPLRPRTHLRAVVTLLVVGVLVLGIVYPLVVTGIAQVFDPSGANGSLLTENGTIIGSSLVGQNVTAPYLFWERVSLSDYNTTAGYETPYGPTDPALGAWLNETILYLKTDWNLSMNQSLPFDLVGPSYTGFDPYLVPAGVLIQIPRVSHAIANLTHQSFDTVVANMTNLVNQYTTNPYLGVVGTSVVNVLELDLAVLQYIHTGG